MAIPSGCPGDACACESMVGRGRSLSPHPALHLTTRRRSYFPNGSPLIVGDSFREIMVRQLEDQARTDAFSYRDLLELLLGRRYTHPLASRERRSCHSIR